MIRFRQARQFYDVGHYQEALRLLQELNTTHPGNPDVLYLAALCLEKVNRLEDALRLCEQLTVQFQDLRAMEMIQRISVTPGLHYAGQAPPHNLAPADQDSVTPTVSFTGAARVGRPEASRVWNERIVLWSAVLGLAFLAVLPTLVLDLPADSLYRAKGPYHTIEVMGLVRYAILFAASLLGFLGGAYGALQTMKALPHRELAANLLSLAEVFALIELMRLLPLFGLVGGVVLVSRRYELGCGGLILFFALGFLGSFVTAFVPLIYIVKSLPPGALS